MLSVLLYMYNLERRSRLEINPAFPRMLILGVPHERDVTVDNARGSADIFDQHSFLFRIYSSIFSSMKSF